MGNSTSNYRQIPAGPLTTYIPHASDFSLLGCIWATNLINDINKSIYKDGYYVKFWYGTGRYVGSNETYYSNAQLINIYNVLIDIKKKYNDYGWFVQLEKNIDTVAINITKKNPAIVKDQETQTNNDEQYVFAKAI